MTAATVPDAFDVPLFARRSIAAIVDTLCLVVIFTLFSYGLDAATNDYEYRWTSVFFYVGTPILLLSYFVVAEGLTSRTPGKALCGVVVVRRNGEPCGWSCAIVRNVFRIVDGFPYVLPYFIGALILGTSSDRRRLGDRIAGTVVVRNH